MEPWEREIVRRSTVMLARGQQTPLKREQVLELIEDLDRLEQRDRDVRETVRRLRTLLETLEL